MLDEGEDSAARQLLQDSEGITLTALENGNDHWALRYNLAAVASLRGDTRSALVWLGAAYENGFRDHRLLALDPTLSSVRKAPGFKQLQRDIGFYVVNAAEQLALDEDLF